VPSDKRAGHEKGLKWWATLRGQRSDIGQSLIVDGDTAYYAWVEGARLMGIEPHCVEVEPIATEAKRRGPNSNHDPWYWLKTEDKDGPKSTKSRGRKAAKKQTKGAGSRRKGNDTGAKSKKAAKSKRAATKRRGKAARRNPKSNR
jgi:hypothetical protein